MIVDNLDVYGTRFAAWPFETYPPLAVDPNTELAFTIAGKRFKTIAAQLRQIHQVRSRIQCPEALFGLAAERFEFRDPHALG